MVASPACADPLPTQDNELVLAVSTKALFFTDAEDPLQRVTRTRVATHLTASVGLLNRGTEFLDLVIEGGPSVLFFGGDGFRHDLRSKSATVNVVPGGHIRGAIRGVLPYGILFGGGLVASVFAAPATGTMTRIGLDISAGSDIWRSQKTHMSIELVYNWAFRDGLSTTDGTPTFGDGQSLGIRVEYGF